VALWISASGSAGLLMPLPFVTPNQMSEYARRRDLIQLRPFLSPCRGLGCARGWHRLNYKLLFHNASSAASALVSNDCAQGCGDLATAFPSGQACV
jgi:hypothetical protein